MCEDVARSYWSRVFLQGREAYVEEMRLEGKIVFATRHSLMGTVVSVPTLEGDIDFVTPAFGLAAMIYGWGLCLVVPG